MRRVIDLTGLRAGDREAEAPDRRVLTAGDQAVHLVRRDIHQVTLTDLPALVADDHLTPPVENVIELVRRMGMRVDRTAAGDLELVDKLQRPTCGKFTHTARRHEIPNRSGPIVLHDRLYG